MQLDGRKGKSERSGKVMGFVLWRNGTFSALINAFITWMRIIVYRHSSCRWVSLVLIPRKCREKSGEFVPSGKWRPCFQWSVIRLLNFDNLTRCGLILMTILDFGMWYLPVDWFPHLCKFMHPVNSFSLQLLCLHCVGARHQFLHTHICQIGKLIHFQFYKIVKFVLFCNYLDTLGMWLHCDIRWLLFSLIRSYYGESSVTCIYYTVIFPSSLCFSPYTSFYPVWHITEMLGMRYVKRKNEKLFNKPAHNASQFLIGS